MGNITVESELKTSFKSLFFFLYFWRSDKCARMNLAVLLGLLLSFIVARAAPWPGNNIQAEEAADGVAVEREEETAAVHRGEIEKVANNKRNKGPSDYGCGQRCGNYVWCKRQCKRRGKGATCEDGCKSEKHGCGCPW